MNSLPSRLPSAMPKSFTTVRQIRCLKDEHIQRTWPYSTVSPTVEMTRYSVSFSPGPTLSVHQHANEGTMGIDHTHVKVQVWLRLWLVSLVSVEDASVEMVNSKPDDATSSIVMLALSVMVAGRYISTASRRMRWQTAYRCW